MIGSSAVVSSLQAVQNTVRHRASRRAAAVYSLLFIICSFRWGVGVFPFEFIINHVFAKSDYKIVTVFSQKIV